MIIVAVAVAVAAATVVVSVVLVVLVFVAVIIIIILVADVVLFAIVGDGCLSDTSNTMRIHSVQALHEEDLR